MSDSSRPHGLQPTRLLRPWDSPGKSAGVGRHHLLQVGCFITVVLICFSLRISGVEHVRVGHLYALF